MKWVYCLLLVFLLFGCGTLKYITEEPGEFITDAQPTVEATRELTKDFPIIPGAAGIALGYLLHFLRIVYKKKVGSNLNG